MALDRNEILVKAAPKTTEVEVEGLGPVTLRKLTGAGREKFLKLTNNKEAQSTVAQLVAMSLIVDGKAVFDNKEGIEALNAMDGEVLDNLAKEVLKLNKLLAEDAEEAKKPSSTTPSEDSSSD